ncbi:hypothetical protein LCM4577_22565 [Mesorhizobium sp. LCM 4577]|nr:hypothetical protein LCM4577_22565 [Mesorhizobium sp. LCM 4577]
MLRRRGVRPALKQVGVMLIGIAKRRDGIALIFAEGRIEFSCRARTDGSLNHRRASAKTGKHPAIRSAITFDEKRQNLPVEECLQLH